MLVFPSQRQRPRPHCIIGRDDYSGGAPNPMTRVSNELAPGLGYLKVSVSGKRVQRLIMDHTLAPFSGGTLGH